MKPSSRKGTLVMMSMVFAVGVTVVGCQVVRTDNDVTTSSVDSALYWWMLGAALAVAGIGAAMIWSNCESWEGYGFLLLVLVPFWIMWIASGNNWRIDSEGFATPRLLSNGMKSERIEFSEIRSVVLHTVPGRRGSARFCTVHYRNGESARIPRPEESVETHLLTALRTHRVSVSEQQGGAAAQGLEAAKLLALIVPALAVWVGLAHALA